MAKKQSSGKRRKEKYPALKPQLNLKTRYELIDYDYVDQLTDKEKDWLNKFTEEYTNANFNHKGPKIQKKKKHEKESYDRNNSRNRCILTRVKAQNKDVDLYSLENELSGFDEDSIIKQIDEEKVTEKIHESLNKLDDPDDSSNNGKN